MLEGARMKCQYAPQGSGCYHQYTKKRGKWKLSRCPACGEALEHYLQQNGVYVIRHRCGKAMPRGRPVTTFFDANPEEPRTVSDRLDEGFFMLDEDGSGSVEW